MAGEAALVIEITFVVGVEEEVGWGLDHVN